MSTVHNNSERVGSHSFEFIMLRLMRPAIVLCLLDSRGLEYCLLLAPTTCVNKFLEGEWDRFFVFDCTIDSEENSVRNCNLLVQYVIKIRSVNRVIVPRLNITNMNKLLLLFVQCIKCLNLRSENLCQYFAILEMNYLFFIKNGRKKELRNTEIASFCGQVFCMHSVLSFPFQRIPSP